MAPILTENTSMSNDGATPSIQDADVEGHQAKLSPSLSEEKATAGEDIEHQVSNYIKGWRLHVISAAWVLDTRLYTSSNNHQNRLSLALFLTNMEIPIVTTSIVGITDDLQGFNQSSWLTVAYLLTYVGRALQASLFSGCVRTADRLLGFLIIWAKLSDIFGRKLFATLAASIFIIFSGACGAAQTITQL